NFGFTSPADAEVLVVEQVAEPAQRRARQILRLLVAQKAQGASPGERAGALGAATAELERPDQIGRRRGVAERVQIHIAQGEQPRVVELELLPLAQLAERHE